MRWVQWLFGYFIRASLQGEQQTEAGSSCVDKIMDGEDGDEFGHLALGWAKRWDRGQHESVRR